MNKAIYIRLPEELITKLKEQATTAGFTSLNAYLRVVLTWHSKNFLGDIDYGICNK